MNIQEEMKKYIDQASSQINVGKEKLEGLVASLALDEKKAHLESIISTLREKGLKDTVSSWVGTGENHPINPEKIKEALGVHRIEELAQQAKMKVSEVPQALSSLLPQLIDKLTPDGKEPANGIAAAAVKFLKGIQDRTGGSHG